MSAQQVIDQARPLLDQVLGQIGLHQSGTPLDFVRLREPFSAWLQNQVVPPEDLFFLASVVGAFICEDLVQHNAAERYIQGRQIWLRVPMQSGIAKDFDPYATALGLIQSKGSLGNFLATVGT